MIRTAQPSDAESIARIYNHYVLNTVITFEEAPVTAAEMATRLADVHSSSLPWLVVEENGNVAGYAYATKWKGRSAYRYSVECTVYLALECIGRGYGSRLYEVLFAELRNSGLHAVIAGITLPNVASVALHEKFGMSKVAHFQEVGFKFGRWLDVGYWECLLAQ